MNELEELVRKVYSKLEPLPDMTYQEKRIQMAIELAKEMAGNGWFFQMDGDNLFCTTPMLTFTEPSYSSDTEISSRYEITVRPDNSHPLVEALDGKRHWPSPHPHVDDDGIPCMGNDGSVYVREPFIKAQAVANMLSGGIYVDSTCNSFHHFIERD